MFYLSDGRMNRSLKTRVRRYAEALLEQYIKGKYRIEGGLTVGEYYERWIKTKREPLVRKSASRDYRQHFTRYILPEFTATPLLNVSLTMLANFRQEDLLPTGISLKTAKNAIDGSFRAMWRDAMREGLVNHNPFDLLKWPDIQRPRPDPFSIVERELILAWFYENQTFFFPYVRFQFETGCRPSESTALKWNAIQPPFLTIEHSRNLGKEGNTKTKASKRTIKVSDALLQIILAQRMPWQGPNDHVFMNTENRPLTHSEFVKIYWHRCFERLEEMGAEIKYREPYKMRHTAITEAIKRGNMPAHVAQYFGTSIQMIQEDYCGQLELDTAEIQQFAASSVASPTGFEPVTSYSLILAQAVNTRINTKSA